MDGKVDAGGETTDGEGRPCSMAAREQVVAERFEGHYLNVPGGGTAYSGGYADLSWSNSTEALASISFSAELEDVILGHERLRLEFEIYDQGQRLVYEGPSPLYGNISIDRARGLAGSLRVLFMPASESGTPSPLAITFVDQDILITVQEVYQC